MQALAHTHTKSNSNSNSHVHRAQLLFRDTWDKRSERDEIYWLLAFLICNSTTTTPPTMSVSLYVCVCECLRETENDVCVARFSYVYEFVRVHMPPPLLLLLLLFSISVSLCLCEMYIHNSLYIFRVDFCFIIIIWYFRRLFVSVFHLILLSHFGLLLMFDLLVETGTLVQSFYWTWTKHACVFLCICVCKFAVCAFEIEIALDSGLCVWRHISHRLSLVWKCVECGTLPGISYEFYELKTEEKKNIKQAI